MRTNCVAILDIRSAEITAVVGERGVNGTFIIKSKYASAYDGYAEGELLDIESFVTAVCDVVKSTLSGGSGVKSFYVGVPGEFLKLINVDKVLSFPSAKKITSADCRTLITLSTPQDGEQWKTIRHSCLYYVLSDKRKVIDPVGAISDSLQGKCCFYQCNGSFIGILSEAFKRFKEITSVNLIPTICAEAMYLVPPEKRDECAILFDFGYISSSYSVICGNGILYSESFSVGIGHIAFYLMQELDIPFEVASTFLSTVNLNAKERLSSTEECVYEGVTYKFSTAKLRDIIRDGLDGICATIEECRQSFSGRNIDGKPLLVTGEGIKVVRGTAEHLAGRLVKGVEVIAPNIPYYDKPHFSSTLSLLDMALDDAK
ncbi:MAG: hypothetical protein HDQ88_10025 [Clostridia bacterium]|nr:hypothetical protein [Clostridia bacterium]